MYERYLEPETFPPAQLVDWLDTLPYIIQEQRDVLRLRTGLQDGYRRTLTEIAEVRGTNPGNISCKSRSVPSDACGMSVRTRWWLGVLPTSRPCNRADPWIARGVGKD